MNYIFSDRIISLQPSAIREILKATSDPSVISFAAGNPAPEAFPIEDVRRITAEILENSPIAALQYSITEGYPALRTALSDMLKKRYDIGNENDGLLVVSGAQQGIDLATRCLLNEGDTVICEAPSFIGSLNCFRSYRANLVGVDMDEDGINLEKLEDALKANPKARFIYLIPNFQNPSGITMSWEKRKAVYALAKQYSVLIIEDNPYGDLRFSGEHIPAIKTLDTENLVVYCGSFSKILSPGMRVGFVCAHNDVLAKMTVAKQCNDVHTTILSQMICHKFITECDLDAHIAKLQAIYRGKCKLMLDHIDTDFHPAVAYTKPEGGLFIWCTLPQGSDMMNFCRIAAQNKVAVVPGSAFTTDDEVETTSFRLNFSTPTDDKIAQGCTILGKLTRELF
ncbi:PLP-dependent aminotransferase family protein [Hydrogenoanaerobacterium sp.]|uniref:aminotransferase-like domain-containing protein n=1 Tax=Hydrogenoanaerobacterium sp. TaxID=2953763 RepID=UPI0028984825|nr:PLP-dependent aminotransferase family protein [Hydrogenoanaerobacterium sp.]